MNTLSIRTTLLALELGSLSAAAAQMGVPVSTVSRRARELESELGRRLIVRSGRGVRPAEEAADALMKLRDALLLLDDCHATEPAITRLRVTATLEMTISLLPRAIPRFQERYPDVVIELLGEDRITGLIEADFDLAIRAGALNDPNLIGKPLPNGGFILVATPKLAKTITSIEQLASTPMIEISGPPPGLTGHWDVESFNLRPPVLARVNTFTGALPCLLDGLAYAQMPRHLVRDYLKSKQLIEIQDANLNEIPIHALYPKRHRNQAIIKAFIEEVDGLMNA